MPRTPDAPPATGPPTNGATGNAAQGTGGNGRHPSPADSDSAVSHRPPGPSTRPALIVLGVAFLVLLVGFIGALATSSGSKRSVPLTSLPTAKGAGITATPGRHALAPIVKGGQPADDILDAVPLPKGTALQPGSAVNNGIGLYDHSLSFVIPVSEQRVITFFGAELPALKWQIVSQGSAPKSTPGYRIVGQHPSSDGYEWEIGITVSPTTFRSVAGSSTETTAFTLRLFAVTDN